MRTFRLILYMIMAMILVAIYSNSTRAQEVGDTMRAIGYCVTEEAVRALAAATTERDDVGYNLAMLNPDIPCFSTRLHSVPPVEGVLTERLFSITREDGLSFQFWRAENPWGTPVFVWSLMTGA